MMVHSISADWLDAVLSVDEVEADLGAPDSGVRDDWEKLKAEMKPGDLLMRFASPVESWERLAGRTGIALVRDGKVVDAIVTMVS
jgi:hypothetical protein